MEIALNKLRLSQEELRVKDIKLFNKCVDAQFNKDQSRAIIYANECLEVRKIAKLVMNSELSLEQAILRIQTIEELGDVMVSIKPIVEIIQETGNSLSNILPSVANSLNEVNSMLRSSLNQIGLVHEPNIPLHEYSKETASVLNEANSFVEKKLREQFPELPKVKNESNKDLKVPIALSATGDAMNDEEFKNDEELKDQVYNYIKSCNGQFSVLKCASRLSVFPKDVEKLVLQLKEEGRVKLE